MTKKRIVNTTSKDINDIEENISDAKYNDDVKALLRLQTQRLNELLEEKQIPQDEFAKKVGIAGGTLSNYCSGKKLIKSEFLPKIAKVLNVSTDYLLGVSEVKNYSYNELNKRFGLNDNAIEVLEVSFPKESINELFDRKIDSVNYLFEEIKNYKDLIKELNALNTLTNKNKEIELKINAKKFDIRRKRTDLDIAFLDLLDEKIDK